MKRIITLMLAVLLVVSAAPLTMAASTLPAPIMSFGFDEDEGMTIVGGELTTDADRGGILTLNGGAKHESYATIDSDIFASTDWSDGMTIAFWVKADNADAGIAPLYSFNIADSGCEGYIATTDSLEIAINTDGNSGNAPYARVWADPAVVDATAEPVLTAGEWEHIAVTLSASGMTIYVNGEVYSEPSLGPSSANAKVFLDQLQYIYGLQLGNWNCEWWEDIGAFAGSYDDVYVFNSSLSQEDVQAVMTASYADLTAGSSSGSGAVIGIVVAVVVVAVVAVVAVVVLKKKKPTDK
ncbi:MAG: LamG domain-containing protein [Firmicutes bacterium]|nr:LamG domain-containing protein [Bacillota bacterium]